MGVKDNDKLRSTRSTAVDKMLVLRLRVLRCRMLIRNRWISILGRYIKYIDKGNIK